MNTGWKLKPLKKISNVLMLGVLAAGALMGPLWPAAAADDGLRPRVPPEDLLVDNSDAGFTQQSGTWFNSSVMGGHYGSDYVYRPAGDGSSVVRWAPNLGSGDDFNVYARWTGGSNRTSKATYTVHHAGGTSTVVLDQRRSGGKWVLLGCYAFDEGPDSYVELTDEGNGYVIADAVMWVWGQYSVIVDNTDPEFTKPNGTWPAGSATTGHYGSNYAFHVPDTGQVARWTPGLASTTNYSVYARWTWGKNRSRKATYTVSYNGGTQALTVNQKGFGGQWILLGTFPFQDDSSGHVDLDSSPLGTVIADAVMWQYQPYYYNVVDNTDSGFTEQVGTWPTSSHSGGYYGADYAHHGAGSGSVARWTPDLTNNAWYGVYARWTGGSNRSNRATYSVNYSGGDSQVTVSHQKNSGKWMCLGYYPFAVGTGGYVELENSPDGLVVADAVMWQQQIAAGLVVDNTDTEFSVLDGDWSTSTGSSGYYGPDFAYHKTGVATDKVRWTPIIPGSMWYSVYARWTAHNKRSRKATYTVHHAWDDDTVTVNQRGFGGEWVFLGNHPFNSGTSGYVELAASPDGTVVADAIMWVPGVLPIAAAPARSNAVAGSNEPPVAAAACLTEARAVGSPVVLSAADSYDPDDGPEPLTYQWTQLAGPEVDLERAQAAEAGFTPAASGVYLFELQISDGEDSSEQVLTVNVEK